MLKALLSTFLSMMIWALDYRYGAIVHQYHLDNMFRGTKRQFSSGIRDCMVHLHDAFLHELLMRNPIDRVGPRHAVPIDSLNLIDLPFFRS